jgi:hypothetical protein
MFFCFVSSAKLSQLVVIKRVMWTAGTPLATVAWDFELRKGQMQKGQEISCQDVSQKCLEERLVLSFQWGDRDGVNVNGKEAVKCYCFIYQK